MSSAGLHPMSGRSELRVALSACKHALAAAALLSCVLNLLMLSGSLFMLLVYDQVIPSHSFATLAGLTLLVTVLFGFQAVIEVARGRILAHIGGALDVKVSPRVYASIAQIALTTRGGGDGLQPIRDLDQVRSFVSGPGLPALFDLPWIALYLGICFAFHFLIGMTALAGAVILLALALLTEVLSSGPIQQLVGLASTRNALALEHRQNAGVIQALGMNQRLQRRWRAVHHEYLRAQHRTADVTGSLSALSRVLRMLLQSIILAVGAYLVIEQKATGGIIVASSILSARALAPVELAIAHWRSMRGARESWTRLDHLLAGPGRPTKATQLPAPTSTVAVEGLAVAPPRSEQVTVRDLTFSLSGGQVLGIIGPSGSGKSSLARAMVGVWPALRGKVALDGAPLNHWDEEALGRHVGYLPQEVELLSGNVAQNICRFEEDAPDELIIAAARRADIHNLILQLPRGYQTEVGQGGAALSAGQRQRIALARALYRDPFLVVLDEPNSNLDAAGEVALVRAVAEVKGRGGAAVLIAHRPNALSICDLVLLLADGRAQAFGPREAVLSRVLTPFSASRPPAPTPSAGQAPGMARQAQS